MTTHIIGGGIAGLAAACTLTEAGEPVILHEAAKAAGGRCRSYYDPQLDARIDNGNHLLLSGNTATMAYLARIGTADSLTGPATALFPFHDLATGRSWSLHLNAGRLPWWIFSTTRRAPGTGAADYLALLKLRRAAPDDLLAPLIGSGDLARNLLEPFAIAALNTMPGIAAAGPFQAVIAETIERGGSASMPRFPRLGLSESFIDPAITWLAAHGAELRLNDRVTALDVTQKTILAVPPWIALDLLPELIAPREFEAIYNLHFKCRVPPGPAGFWGFTGGLTEWAFAKGEILSVTISAANRYAEIPTETLTRRVWSELAAAFDLPPEIPPHRVVREKRATFVATPAQLGRRPATRTAQPNLMLAGDWTATGLPATIEGAIRSGNAAALALLGRN